MVLSQLKLQQSQLLGGVAWLYLIRFMRDNNEQVRKITYASTSGIDSEYGLEADLWPRFAIWIFSRENLRAFRAEPELIES